MPMASSSLSIRRPAASLTAAVRLIIRPAPWHVVPNEQSMLPACPARTQLAVPMLPGIITGCPIRRVNRRNLGMTGRKGARRSLAVDADLLWSNPFADGVLLELRDVVSNVVHQLHPQLFPRLAEDPREDLARLVGQELAVAPGVVRGRRIAPRYACPSGLRTGAQASCESGSSNPYRFGRVLEGRQVVVAHLVAQPARAGVDEHRDLALVQTHDLGRDRVVNPVDDLDFEEMVARAERAALIVTPRDGAVADPAGIGSLETAASLGD